MPVDPQKPRKILVVHGVQSGTDEDLNQHLAVKDLVQDRLNGIPLNFETDIYRYENINDDAQKELKFVLNLFLSNLVAKKVLGKITDVIGDVVIALNEGSTALKIRQGLMDEIEKNYESGKPLYLLAHSLGSIYAFDAINELIKNPRYFDRNSRSTWPVQGLVTIGSPIGLQLFKRTRVIKLGTGRHYFRWVNLWDRTDPVVSGSFYGKPQQGYTIAERFSTDADKSGWFIQDRIVDVGRAWLLAHVGYWNHPTIGDDLATMITS